MGIDFGIGFDIVVEEEYLSYSSDFLDYDDALEILDNFDNLVLEDFDIVEDIDYFYWVRFVVLLAEQRYPKLFLLNFEF